MSKAVTGSAFKPDNTFDPAQNYWDDPPKYPAIVLVHTPWCHFCKAFLPVFEKAASRAKDVIGFYNVDGDSAQIPGVDGYPTVMVYMSASAPGIIYDGDRDMKGFWHFIRQVKTRGDAMGQ